MAFMSSLFGSESTGKPRARRKIRMSQTYSVEKESDSSLVGVDSAYRSRSSSDLPPEIEEGNVEYKLKLVNPSPGRLQHLVTQLKWRLREGQGEAIYEIGVEDNGVCAGLTDRELNASISTLKRMARKLDASLAILREREIMPPDGKETGLRMRVAEVLIRKVPDNQQFIDLRIAVLGGVDAGKSTLLGVLTQGEMDNGRGKARLNLFRHLHEVQSGRTSSISLDVIGFDSKGELINYQDYSVEEICEKSTKLVTFIDLAGHQKYQKTTIFGLTGYKPHFALLVVAANMGVVGTTREHLALALALEMPVFVVVTKADVCRGGVVERTLGTLEKMLKGPGCKKIPMRVQTEDDAISAAANFDKEQVVPIFTVSSVTGVHLDMITKFLNLLPASFCSSDRQHQLQELPEFHIDEIFNVPQVGTIAAGLLVKGIVAENSGNFLIGPDAHGQFFPTHVESVHRNKTACRVVEAGQGASLAVGEMENSEMTLRKGMVIVDNRLNPIASMAFEAKVFVLFHQPQTICVGFQTTVHIGNVCQTATIVDIVEKPCLKIGESALIKMLFLKQPEYLPLGSRMLFTQGSTKGIGHVTKTCLDPSQLPRVTRTF